MHEPDVNRRRAAMQLLMRIPGVVRVGYGIKQTSGQVTGEHAYRVYVVNKRPLEAIAPAERIPAMIDGVATDVLAADVRRPMTKTPSISAGDTISRFIPNDSQASGTLGRSCVSAPPVIGTSSRISTCSTTRRTCSMARTTSTIRI